MIEESGGQTSVTFSYPEREATAEEIILHGYEFGTKVNKLIFNAGIARKLVQLGHRVVDIKPLKENPDKTAFVFEVTDRFVSDLTRISN